MSSSCRRLSHPQGTAHGSHFQHMEFTGHALLPQRFDTAYGMPPAPNRRSPLSTQMWAWHANRGCTGSLTPLGLLGIESMVLHGPLCNHAAVRAVQPRIFAVLAAQSAPVSSRSRCECRVKMRAVVFCATPLYADPLLVDLRRGHKEVVVIQDKPAH